MVKGRPRSRRQQRGLGHPALAEFQDFLRRADSDELAHPKGLQTVQAARRLMPEYVGFDVELQPAGGQLAAGRHDGIYGIAGRGRQHQVRGGHRGGPVAAVVVTVDRRTDRRFGAMQSAYTTQQIGEALEVAGFLQLLAAHHRREAHDFRFGIPLPRNVALEALDDMRVQRGARIHAVDAHGPKQSFRDVGQRIEPAWRRRWRSLGC